EPHVVADQGSAGAHREQRAFGLIPIERYFQKGSELWVVGSLGKQFRERCGPALRIPPPRDEIERIVVGAELVTRLRRYGHEGIEFVIAVIRQHSVMPGVEHSRGGLTQGRRALRSHPEMDAAPAVVAQI